MRLNGQKDAEQSKPSIWANIKAGSVLMLAKLPYGSHLLLNCYTPFLVPCYNGDDFTLPFDEPLARTRFKRRWELLPGNVADISCRTMTPAQLLTILNGIAETQYRLSPTMQELLSESIARGSDVGYVYGYLRHDWQDGDSLHNRTRRLKAEDDEMRESAIVGDTIVNASIPPRRIWDLYANRVIPSFVLRDPLGNHRGLQPVSHSWRPPSERHSVLTTVNSKAWRVPIPRDTSLEDIRNELLMLGAEYVWLDVLCLRQFDELLPEAESIRKKEWRLDIPTIGRVYEPAPHRNFAVIVYFNGLGRTFRAGLVDPEDNYHWMNRVWTVQELSTKIVIGGLRPRLRVIDLSDSDSWPVTVNRDFLELVRSQPTRDTKLTELDLEQLCQAIRVRACSNPTDKVACLSYFMLKTIPIYDPDLSPNLAWDMLIENMDGNKRTEILFSDLPPRTQPDSWRPTWEDFVRFKGSGDDYTHSSLTFLDGTSPAVGDAGGCVYYHNAYVVRRARFRKSEPSSNGQRIGRVDVTSHDGTIAASFKIRRCGDSVDQDTVYVLTGFRYLPVWVVAREAGVRIIYGEKVTEVVKVCTMEFEYIAKAVLDRLPGDYQHVAYR